MAKASDNDLLGMLDEVSDDHDRRNDYRRFMGGGVVELSRAFAGFAKEHPARAIALLDNRLRPGVHERVVGEAVRELAALETVDPSVTRDLIRRLQSKGFSSRSWRQDAASAFDALASRLGGLEECDLFLIRDWLDDDAQAAADHATRHGRDRAREQASNRKPEQPPSAHLFGRGGGAYVLPQGNFTLLSAIAKGLLAREPPDCDRWLSELEAHVQRPEDPKVWTSLLVLRSHALWWADPARTTALLDTLFDRLPEAYGAPEVIQALWRLKPRLSARLKTTLLAFWTGHADPHLRQAAGELTAAIAIVDGEAAPSEVQAVEGIMARDDVDARVGVLFSAAAGWREDDLSIRSRSHELLMRQSTAMSEAEAHAWSTAIKRKRPLAPDVTTRALLQKMLGNEALLKACNNRSLAEALEGLLLHPGTEELVLSVVDRMTGMVLRDPARQQSGLLSGELVALTVALQRTPAGIREHAMDLYERLLDGAVYGADEAAASAMRL